MPTSRFQTSSATRESAVAETVKRVNAEAFDLLIRRAEINQRIRCLHQVMKALQELAANRTLNVCVAAHHAPVASPVNQSTPHRYSVVWMRSPMPDRSQHLPAALMRACRIALMEAGGTASADEIRARILRRGSFRFADSGLADTAIIQTLNVMTDGGEVRRLEAGSQSMWQRIVPA